MRPRGHMLKADQLLLGYAVLLIGFGLVSLMSASAPVGFAKFNDAYWYVKRQVVFGLAPGLAALLLCAHFNYRALRSWSLPLYGASLILLALVFVPSLGVVINGSRSWLNLFGFQLQPSEFVKLTLIVLLASQLSRHEGPWESWQDLVPMLGSMLPALLLIVLQPDVGTVSILGITILALLYLARVPGRYLLMLALSGVIALGILIAMAPYRAERLTAFLHPELDPRGVGYQINQAFLAIGSGGLTGLGLGQSRQKFQYLPEVSADSIFAVIGEELGLIGSAGFLALFLAFGLRLLKISQGAPDSFGRLLAGGIAVWLLTQAFFNMGAMVGALPLTGVPLPFVSHGGSALLASLTAVGVIASVSKFSRAA